MLAGSGDSNIRLDDEDEEQAAQPNNNIVMQNMQVKKAKPMKIKMGQIMFTQSFKQKENDEGAANGVVSSKQLRVEPG